MIIGVKPDSNLNLMFILTSSLSKTVTLILHTSKEKKRYFLETVHSVFVQRRSHFTYRRWVEIQDRIFRRIRFFLYSLAIVNEEHSLTKA